VHASAWAGFAYVATCSMWMGFFAWYRGLAWGGTLRVSQVQLLQPFVSILLSVPLLGERLAPATLGFSIAVMACVYLGRHVRPARSAPRPQGAQAGSLRSGRALAGRDLPGDDPAGVPASLSHLEGPRP
jgi:hypothetical protein